MVRILLVCHGNIASAATSYEEIGNPVHHGTAKILDRLGIEYSGKCAIHLEKSDYEKYDYLVCMDSANVRNTLRIVGDDEKKKIHKLLEFVGSYEDVADPWYTGDFDKTYKDILSGCEGILKYIKENEKKY